MKLKLSDAAIAQLVKLFQVGLLTGTDISDNFRTLELVQNGERLDPDPEYMIVFEKGIQKMQDEAEVLSKQANDRPHFVSGFSVVDKKAN